MWEPLDGDPSMLSRRIHGRPRSVRRPLPRHTVVRVMTVEKRRYQLDEVVSGSNVKFESEQLGVGLIPPDGLETVALPKVRLDQRGDRGLPQRFSAHRR